jgi:anthranilate synthase/aminodeoxychorismate synthase-like glutamine amidotransferase
MILLIDNYDSFTYNIYDYLLQCHAEVVLYRNNEIELAEIEKLNPQSIVLSPGPGKPKDHNLLFRVLERYYAEKPILGVCLGQQAIGEFFGAELVKAPLPVHGKQSMVQHNNHRTFSGVPKNFQVGRYHSLVLKNCDEKVLEITSKTEDGLNMSLAHNTLPIWAVQFHPESILTPQGIKIFENWAALLKEL